MTRTECAPTARSARRLRRPRRPRSPGAAHRRGGGRLIQPLAEEGGGDPREIDAVAERSQRRRRCGSFELARERGVHAARGLPRADGGGRRGEDGLKSGHATRPRRGRTRRDAARRSRAEQQPHAAAAAAGPACRRSKLRRLLDEYLACAREPAERGALVHPRRAPLPLPVPPCTLTPAAAPPPSANLCSPACLRSWAAPSEVGPSSSSRASIACCSAPAPYSAGLSLEASAASASATDESEAAAATSASSAVGGAAARVAAADDEGDATCRLRSSSRLLSSSRACEIVRVLSGVPSTAAPAAPTDFLSELILDRRERTWSVSLKSSCQPSPVPGGGARE